MVAQKALLKSRTAEKLRDALERLKQLFRIGYELEVVWLPDGNDRLSGEVEGSTIKIYEKNFDKALDVLIHEFFDYEISKVVKPYRDIANALIKLMNEQAYRRKEMFIEAVKEPVKKLLEGAD